MKNKKAAIPLFKLILVIFIVAIVIYWVVPVIYKLSKSVFGFNVDDLTEEEKAFYNKNMAVMYINNLKSSSYYWEILSNFNNMDSKFFNEKIEGKIKPISTDDCKSTHKFLWATITGLCDVTFTFSQKIANDNIIDDFKIKYYYKYNGNIIGRCTYNSSDKYSCLDTAGNKFEIKVEIEDNKITFFNLPQNSQYDISYFINFPKLKTQNYFYQDKWYKSGSTNMPAGAKQLELIDANIVVGLKTTT